MIIKNIIIDRGLSSHFLLSDNFALNNCCNRLFRKYNAFWRPTLVVIKSGDVVFYMNIRKHFVQILHKNLMSFHNKTLLQ